MKKTGVAVSGVGCIAATGANAADCMSSMFRRKRNMVPFPTRFHSTHKKTHPVFEVPPHYFPKGLQERDDILYTDKLALAAAHEAIGNAGFSPEDIAGKHIGVCVGTTVGISMNNENFYHQFRSGGTPSMEPINRFLKGNPASTIAREFSLYGPCQAVVNACSSGTDAIGIAFSWIRSGLCDIVLAGGADEFCHVTYNGFIALMITDTKPTRPFDKNRKGLNLGEGGAILVLESEASLAKRKKDAAVHISSYASSTDAYHLTAPHPQGDGLRRALKEVLKTGKVTASDIAFVNAHGTGTPDNDRVETIALNDLLPGVPFLSTKGYTGHTLGAAGAIEAVFTIKCLEAGKIPANAGFRTADPDLPLSPVSKQTRIKKDFAISQSLAFGGSNGVLLFQRM